ncbi:MAG: NUDIX hydrolase [Candidatus Thorarchaeota archaeon]
MITFEKESNVFNYRVAGVAINNNRVLLQKSILEDFWFLPGGRCEFLEVSKDALIREMKEEIGLKVKIVRLLYFVENFFFLNEKHYHEISVLYLMEFPSDSKIIFESTTFYRKESELGTEEYPFYRKKFDLLFKWFDLHEIENIRLYPIFLRKSLKSIKQFPEHIINYDD